jgi:two-component system, cell cycle sensor histidine kinase and response regulator CckA
VSDIPVRKNAKSSQEDIDIRLRRILDALPLGVGILAPDGTVLEINRRAIERYSLPMEGVIGRPFVEVFPWSATPAFQTKLRAALVRAASGHAVPFAVEVPHSSGSPVLGEAWITPISDDDGLVTHLIFSGEDITRRRRTEDALRESENRFHISFMKSPCATVLSRMSDGVLIEVNEAFESVIGYSGPEVAGKNSLDLRLYAPETRAKLIAEFQEHGAFRNQEVIVRTKSGDERLMLVNSNLVEIGGQHHVLTAMQDITERRQAENMLAESERRLRTIFDHEPECVKLLGPNCTLLEMNPAGLRFIEADSLDQVVGRSMLDLILPEHRTAFADLSDRVLNGESDTLVFEIQGIRGTRRWLETHAVPLRIEAGEVRVLGITRDITDRKRAIEHLQRMSDLLAAVADGTTDALYVKDLEGRYLLCNPAAAHFMGRTPSEVIGHTDAEFYDADSARLIADRDRHVRESGQTETQEEELTAAGETRIYLATKSPYRDKAGNVIGVLGISRNITERKRLQRQFLQAQKMEAVGQLAGGVAHDFNNLLTIISGYSDLLLNNLPDSDPMRESIKAISEAGERAAGLTRQLLAFSRQSVLEPRVLDLNAIVLNTGKMLRRLIGEDILLTTVLDPKLGRVKVDPGQLEQVLVNLAVNARDAMPKGGKLTIETGNVVLDDGYVASRVDCKPGRYVLLAVSDTGCGMSPEVKSRIFEPFFTTKGVGKGTGLGMAMVFGVVKQSGGSIEVYSELGFGTTFKVYLPAVADAATSTEKRDLGIGGGGTETILLVEDDDGVRALAQMVLQGRGFTVLAAGDGKEAIRAVEKHRGPIDLLLTDVVMPGLDGRDLADNLRQRFPQMKVLFSSGYTDDAVVRHGVLHADVFFLQKPYSPFSLALKVRDVLDKKE